MYLFNACILYSHKPDWNESNQLKQFVGNGRLFIINIIIIIIIIIILWNNYFPKSYLQNLYIDYLHLS